MPARKTASSDLAALTAAAAAKLLSSGLTDSDRAALHIKLTLAADAKARLGLKPVAGLLIPYFTLSGKPTKFWRYRYLGDTRTGFDAVTGKRPQRYAQPYGSTVEVYFPPLTDWEEISSSLTTPVIITEGELKAAAATKAGFPTLGLGGVYSFQSAKANQLIIPALADFGWTGRTAYIVYDSDAATNPDVIAAEQRLAERLVSLGATVYITRLPSTAEGLKQGLDDYLLNTEGGADALTALLGSEATYEYSGSAVLHELSRKVLYVRNPGVVWDHVHQMRLSPANFTAHAYANVHHLATTLAKGGVEVKTKQPAAVAWLRWEARAEAKGLAFAPGAERITAAGDLNTWTGWGVPEPAEGDVKQWHILLRHIFGEDTDARRHFEQWAAYPLQNPGVKMATAYAVWGDVHGSGKTLIGHTLMRIYGTAHSIELKDTDLEDDRNEWAEGKCFVLADDITAKGDRKFMRRLMTMITQKFIRLNPKYIPSYSQPDLINYYFTSNDPDALYMDGQDRRFNIFETHAGKFTPFKAYVDWRDSDAGIAALWAYLLAVDCAGFDPQAPARATDAKRNMIEVGKSELGAWVADFKRNGDYILSKAGLKGDVFPAKALFALYDPDGTKRTTVNAFSRELRREGYRLACKGAPVKLTDGYQTTLWIVRRPEVWVDAAWGDVRAHYEGNILTKQPKKF